MSNLKFKSLFFFITISFSGHILTEISPDQMKMLEQLAPDQRESVMLKMENASALQDEIDEAFEESPSLIKRPELKDFSSEEEYCEDCIYGYNFFQFSPSTFAPSNDTPVNSSYILGLYK